MKKGIKRFLCTLLAACLLCGLVGAAGIAAAETGSYSTCGDGFVWQFDEETGVLTIQGSGPMYDFEDEMDVPWSQYLKQIKKIVVIRGVTSIGKNAFAGCTALEEISLPETVTAIGTGAFKNCESLPTVDLSTTVLTELKADTFTGCTALTKVSLPATVQSVDSAAFHGAQNLQEVVCIGEETQVKQILKDVDLDNAEIIIVSTGDSGDETIKETAPAPVQPQPTIPSTTQPQPTVPEVTEPAGPVETQKVYYEENYKITDTYIDGKLTHRKAVDLGEDGMESIPHIFEYTDFNEFGEPQKITEYSDSMYYYQHQLVVISVCTMEYDANGVLVSESCTKPDGEKVYDSVIVDGVKVQDVYANDTVVSYEYDENGKLVKEDHQGTDFCPYTVQYTYNEAGVLIHKVLDSDSGRLNRKEFTFENGRLVVLDLEDEAYYRYEWNEKGQLVKRYGDLVFFDTKNEWTYEYDESGNHIEETRVDPVNHLMWKTTYENGEMTSNFHYNENGEITYKDVRTKDENGREIHNVDFGSGYGLAVHNSEDTGHCNLTYGYDGTLEKITYFSSDEGKDYYRYSYSFNEATGKWEISDYYGRGIYDTNMGGQKGAEPLADDPLIKYALSLDPIIKLPEVTEPVEIVYEKKGNTITEVWRGDRLIRSKTERYGSVLSTSTYVYNEYGLKTEFVEYRYGDKEEIKYDQNDSPTFSKVTSPSGEIRCTTRWTYSENGESTKIDVYADGPRIETVYNQEGNPVSRKHTDGNGNVIGTSKWTYAENGESTEIITYPEGDREEVVFDQDGNGISAKIIDKDGKVTATTTWTYSENGDTTQITKDADGAEFHSVVDKNEKPLLSQYIDKDGNIIETCTWTYEENGNTIQTTENANGSKSQCITDKDGNIIQTNTWTYEENGNTTLTHVDADGSKSQEVSDKDGNIISTTKWTTGENSEQIQITEYADGSKSETISSQYGNPISDQFIFADGSKRITKYGAHEKPISSQLIDKSGKMTSTSKWSYDADGSITEITENADGSMAGFTYTDSAGDMYTYSYVFDSVTGTWTESYSGTGIYDVANGGTQGSKPDAAPGDIAPEENGEESGATDATEVEATVPEETEPVATEPMETEPAETDPVETEPVATEPMETEPVETEPVETEPVETEPEVTEPEETEPMETEPVETEPVETEPAATEPKVTEAEATEPEMTEPEVTEAAETEPAETEPVVTDPIETAAA